MSEQAELQQKLNVSRETIQRLEHFSELLTKWSRRINLVSASTVPDIWTRHIKDSAQIFELRDASARNWMDLGSGGGLPGVVVAILAHELQPDMPVTLLESDQRKSAFLRTALRETGVPGQIISSRIEETEAFGADILSARALAPLPALLEFAMLHLNPAGTALFHKGASVQVEIASAVESYAFDCETVPSQTHPDAVILKIKDIKRV